MSALPTFAGRALPVLFSGRRSRRLWVAVAAIALAGAGAGAWYLVSARQHAADAARSAEIAAARARVVAAAKAKGLPVTAQAVEETHAAALEARRPSRVADASLAGSLFGVHSWYVPPPPAPYVAPPPAPPPPAPTAPPLPYVFLGSYTPGGDPTVYFVTRGDRVYDIKVGDTIDEAYQIESATSGQLVFLYKPLGQRQMMAIGASP